MLFTFSNMSTVWISRNFEDKIINEHLPCYSPLLTSLFVMSFLVCRAGILLCIKQSLLLKYCFLIICPPREFFVLFVIKVMALVAGRERNTVVSWHSNFFRHLLEVIHDNDELDFRLISTHSIEVLFRTNTIATCTDYDGLIDRWQNKLKTVLFPSKIRGLEKYF